MNQIQKGLETSGWWKGKCQGYDLDTYMLEVANNLGDPVGMRRWENIIEILKPTSSDSAHPNSLSKQYALSGFPLLCMLGL